MLILILTIGYSGLSTRVGDSTESPEFELCGHVWQLRIFPGGSLEAHRAYLSYYLASKSTRSARASYKLSVCSQVAGGTDESFASSGVRSWPDLLSSFYFSNYITSNYQNMPINYSNNLLTTGSFV